MSSNSRLRDYRCRKATSLRLWREEMSSIVDYFRQKHETKECIQRYHKHKEWVFFVALLSIILFLTVWSGWVKFKLTEIEKSLEFHSRFDKALLEEHISIASKLQTDDPEKQKLAIDKLNQLNAEIQRHLNRDYRH